MPTFGLSKLANELTVRLGGKTRNPSAALGSAAVETSRVAARPDILSPTQDALQTAARLKVILGEALRMVTVAGIGPGDGEPELAAQLAVALAAMDESPVLVIDGNVQAPRLHAIFGVPLQPGILDLLEHQSDLAAATRGFELNNLFLLPSGQSSMPLAALLSRPVAGQVFDEIRRTYRYVIIHAGVIRNYPNGTLLASMSDGVIAAVAAGARRRHEVLQFRQELKQLNIPLLGVVLTSSK